MERQFYDVFLKPICSKSLVSSCNNNQKCIPTVNPKQIYFPCLLSVCCMDTLLSGLSPCSCIKQTYAFFEAPIFMVLMASFIAYHSLHDVALSPAVSCQPSEKQRLCRQSQHVRTSKQMTKRDRYGLKRSVVLMDKTQFLKQAFNKV